MIAQGKIVLFPGVNLSRPYPPQNQQRTVRVRHWKQRALPLRHCEDTLEQRIASAKETSATWRDMAASAAKEAEELRQKPFGEAERQRAKERQRKCAEHAETWDRKVLELIEERNRATAQGELLPECGHPHTEERP